MARQQYHEHFQQLLQQLNPAQKAAVLQTEGPVMAIAGPGTGKTHILSARIGQILLSTDAEAHNILCLTFTDAAVNAMRKRLLEFIGPEAHRVHIYTFHSFCNKVIQENLEIFGRYDLEPLSDLERIEIIRTILQQLDVEHPLKFGHRNSYRYEQHLADLFKKMKAERWTAEHLIQSIDQYLEELPLQPHMRYKRNTANYQKGDLKEGTFEKIKRRMDRLKSGAALFDAYEQALEKKQRYDYEDMILWVLNAFEQEPFLLRAYQEQYLYLLVDEFQDTNGAQSTIVTQLVNYWGENPNLFIVGDDDQSIYEFQGARVKNMQDFYLRYANNLLLVLLKYNYRSTQIILDAAQLSINYNQLRIIHQIEGLNLEKKLISAQKDLPAVPVQVQAYSNQLQEEIGIIQQIEALAAKGVALSEIAIIYAQHRQATTLIQLLEKRNLPYQTKRRINILDLPLLHNLRKLMSYIANDYLKPDSNEEVFFEFLHYDFIGIPPRDAAKLLTWMAQETQRQRNLQAYDQLPQWRPTLYNRALLEEIGIQAVERCVQLVEFLDKSIQQYKNWSLMQLVEFILNKSGLILFVSQHQEKAWLTQVLGTFFDFVKQESTKNPRLTLQGLLLLLEQMEANRIGLGLFQVAAAEDGVQLITAHSAKGLEFEHVFMINALKDFWEPRNTVGNRFILPETLTYSDDTDAQEAARRLFYVAMTRAKYGLVISYYDYNTQQKIQTRSCFVDELLEHNPAAVQFDQKPDQQAQDWQLLLLTSRVEQPKVPLLEKAVISGLLEDFRLSISALNTYLNCPLSFYYEYVLRLPTVSSTEAAYGTALHNSLNRIFNLAQRQKESDEDPTLPPVEKLLEIFEFELEKQRPFLSNYTYKERLELGLRHIPLYYAARQQEWQNDLNTATVSTEKPFKNVEWEGIPLTGTIDKLIYRQEKGSKSLHVVDYKTGKLKNKRLQAPSDTQPHGGIYWRQLFFYKILIESASFVQASVSKASIDYMSPDYQGVFPVKSISFNKEGLEQVQNMIKNTHQKIKEHKFDTGCGEAHCKWCNFSQRNITPVSFVNPDKELLDDH